MRLVFLRVGHEEDASRRWLLIDRALDEMRLSVATAHDDQVFHHLGIRAIQH